MLYTAKGTAALLVPFSSVITTMTGSWHAVFMVASGMAALSAFLAIFVLKPMRNAHAQKHSNSSSAVDIQYGHPVKD
jgi:OFA family oxalate/formate antiporter-like MFS transporter